MDATRVLMLFLAPVICAASARSQCQIQKLVPADLECEDYFGSAVAIDGEWAAVGSPLDDDANFQSGAVYVYHREGGGWVQTQKLTGADAPSSRILGISLAMSGDVLVAGAYTDYAQGIQASGSAYVFERTGSTWSQTAKLVASDPNVDDHFGYSVAVSGGRVLVGARDDDERGFDAGAAYVFERVGGTWVQSQKLLASDGNSGDAFGVSVALSGDTALVGAICKEGPGGASCFGAAYVFDLVGSVWAQTQKLLANDGAQGDGFGGSVAIQGLVLVVSATGHLHAGANFRAGAYLFGKQGATWVLQLELRPGDKAHGFGGPLALLQDDLIVSAPGEDEDPSGSAFHFRRSGPTWTQVGKLLSDDGQDGDLLGSGVAVSGDTALVGASLEDAADPSNGACNSGSAYVFELAPTARQYGHCPTGAPCNNKDDHGGCKNSTGQGAVLAACGSGSATGDDLRLHATHLPPLKGNLMFMGTQSVAPVIVGDGLRVVGGAGGVFRYPFLYSDAQGMITRGPGLVAFSQNFPAAGNIQPGQTWFFQTWYRNPTGPCGGFTNMTSAVEVAFGP